MTEPDAGRNELEAMRHVYDAALIAATNEMHDNDSQLDTDIRLMHHLWLRGFRLRALASEPEMGATEALVRAEAHRHEVASEQGAGGKDGTDVLCEAVYQRPAEPRDYLGGSQANMLHDAAKELQRLRKELDNEKAEVLEQYRMAVAAVKQKERYREQLTDLKRRVGRDNLAELLTRCPYLKTAPERTEKVAEWVARALLAELEE
jgi:hypothetical protein